MKNVYLVIVLFSLFTLSACGGGGGGSSNLLPDETGGTPSGGNGGGTGDGGGGTGGGGGGTGDGGGGTGGGGGGTGGGGGGTGGGGGGTGGGGGGTGGISSSPPDNTVTIPATGGYTSQNGPVKSWGIWQNQAALAEDQQGFFVSSLSEPGFYASYQITGEVTPSTALPSGTATWEGEYEGVYQLGDENGTLGAATKDSGTASIDVNFDNDSNQVTVTLTSETTDAETLPEGSDSGGDVWERTADLNDLKNTFGKTAGRDEEYSKIVGAVFGPNAEALAGVYEFDYQKDHATFQVDTDNDGTPDAPARVNDIRGAGWFGGCKDVTDISCFQADATDPDPVTDPDPMDDPMDDPDPVTPPDTYSPLSFGAWADKPADFDAIANVGDFKATLQTVDHYYLRGTRTSSADINAFPNSGTATWAGTYVGQYRTNPVDDPITDADENVWSAFTDDSGTVSMVFDLSGTEMDITLTSTVGNTFPGVSSNVHTPKSSFAFDSVVNFSGGRAGEFYGDDHDTDERGNNAIGVVNGAFFGSGAAEAGGVYYITQSASLTQSRMETQVEAVGVFGATKQ